MASIINSTTTAGVTVTGDNSGSLQLATNNGTTAVTVDTSQNVGIGTNSPSQKLDVANAMQISFGGSNTYLYFQSTNNYIGRDTSGDMQMNVSGGQKILFGVSGAEKMRIDSSGNLLISETTRWRGVGRISMTTGSEDGISILTSAAGLIVRKTSYGNSFIGLWENNGGSTVGSITTDGSTTAYNTSSDYRLKENIAPMTGALATVSLLKPVTYTWKESNTLGQGFIAHELQAVVPDCVHGEKDAVDKDGKIIPQGIDTSFLVATLTASIQELNAKVDAQAVRIAELEGAR